VNNLISSNENTSSVEGGLGFKAENINRLPPPKKQRCTSSPVKKKEYRLSKNVSMDRTHQ